MIAPEQHAYDPPNDIGVWIIAANVINSNTHYGIACWYNWCVIPFFLQFVLILRLESNGVSNVISAGDADEVEYQLHELWLHYHSVFYKTND